MSKTRGVRPITLQKTVDRWKKVLKLSDWEIIIRYATKKEVEDEYKKDNDKDKDLIGFVCDCDSAAKRATILVNKDYHKISGYKQSWNLDTFVLHELTHVVVWASSGAIPEKISKHKKVEEFEEFVCDAFADIIYCIFRSRL